MLAAATSGSGWRARRRGTAHADAANSSRVRVVDLTRQLCDARTCPAVVGGALAFKDPDHLTPVFAATLGPFLRRDIDRALSAP